MKNQEINTQRWLYNYYIELKWKILLILSTLYYHKKITEGKYKGQITALRKGTLTVRKNTFHSTINNRWYDRESPEEVYKDIYESFPDAKKVPFEFLIQSIQLLENKNYNYALNLFLESYINPMLKRWNPEHHDENFSSYIDLTFPMSLKADVNRDECYACGSYHSSYDKNERKIKKDLSTYFHSIKKGNLKEIPFYNLEN